MTTNLIAEVIKTGVHPQAVAKLIAETIEVTEKTARNKINGKTAWTIPEAKTINDKLFGGANSLEYLFKQSEI